MDYGTYRGLSTDQLHDPCVVSYGRTVRPTAAIVSFQPWAMACTTDGSLSEGRVSRDIPDAMTLTIDQTFGNGLGLRTLLLQGFGVINRIVAAALKGDAAHSGMHLKQCWCNASRMASIYTEHVLTV